MVVDVAVVVIGFGVGAGVGAGEVVLEAPYQRQMEIYWVLVVILRSGHFLTSPPGPFLADR